MSLRAALIGGSFVAHGAMVVALGAIRTPAQRIVTAIEVTETARSAPPPEPPREAPPPSEEPEVKAPIKAASRASERLQPDSAPTLPTAALASLPDFGLELSGGAAGAGLAVAPPAGGGRGSPGDGSVHRTLAQAAPATRPTDPCDERPAKPRLVNLPQPAYTAEARAAGVEGKIRVQVTVDESGKVVDARVVTSLGHGLDDAAVEAARAATFEAAVRCGRPSRSTFTIAMRFAAS